MSQEFFVTGLNCQSCVKHVTEALDALEGVRGVVVDLEPKGTSTVHVDSDGPLDDHRVQAALSGQGGYLLVASAPPR